ncbi:hypothetical protein [uncultured Oscillibacter sp.]|nr:hypothetical protein [uncultured Oscillibacter sp.]
MTTGKDGETIEKAMLCDLRLIFFTGGKDTYTRGGIVGRLDEIALAKDQE